MPWADEVARDQTELVYFLRVEGIPYWWFTRRPDASWVAPSNVTFRDGLEVPESMDQSVRPFAAASSVSHMEFRLRDLPEGSVVNSLTQIFSPGRVLNDSSVYRAHLTLNVGPTAVAFIVTHVLNIPATPFDLYAGLETVRVTSRVGTVLSVTRAQYPAVDGAGLGQRHVTIMGGTAAPLALVSSVPWAWHNRRVALFATWYDRAAGTFGALADARLVWTGRMDTLTFDVPTDTWRLSCKPITEDVKRKVFASTGQTSLPNLIQLAGVSAEQRTIRIVHASALTGTPTWTYTTMDAVLAASNYSWLTIGTAVSLAISTVMAATVPLARSWIELDWDADALRFLLRLRNGEPAGTNKYMVTIYLPAPIAAALGFVNINSYGAFTTGTGLVEPGQEIVLATAANTVMTHLWTTESTQIVVVPVDPATFWASQNSDGSQRAAVSIGGRTFVRYTSFDGTTFDGINTGAGNGSLIVGPQAVGTSLFASDAVDLSVKQVYVTPRTFGTETAQTVMRHLLRLMISTGTSGTNGTFDTLRAGMGLAIPDDYIDTQSFLDVETYYGAGYLDRQWIIGEATSLMDIIEAEARLLGFYLVVNTSGQIAARMILRNLLGVSPVDLTESNKVAVTDRASFSISPAALLNYAALRYEYDHGAGEFREEIVFDEPVSQTVYETVRGVTDIEHRGLYAFGGAAPADLAAMLFGLVGLYRDPVPTIGRTINRQLFTRLIPGDVVRLTDSRLPNHYTGTRGVTNQEATVVRVSHNLHSGNGRVDLIVDPMSGDGLRNPLAPSMRVTAFNAVTNVATVAANDFSDPPTTDVAYFAVSDAVLAVEGAATSPAAPTNTARTITAINVGLNQVTLSGGIGGLDPTLVPVYIVFGRRDVVQTSQVVLGTWAADASDNLINNTQDALPYM